MYRRVLFFAVFFGAAALSSWAETGGSGSSDSKLELKQLETSLEKVIGFFTSGAMKAIFSIGLGGLFIGLAMNRENPDLKKRFLFWIIGVGGLLALSSITDAFFTNGALL